MSFSTFSLDTLTCLFFPGNIFNICSQFQQCLCSYLAKVSCLLVIGKILSPDLEEREEIKGQPGCLFLSANPCFKQGMSEGKRREVLALVAALTFPEPHVGLFFHSPK